MCEQFWDACANNKISIVKAVLENFTIFKIISKAICLKINVSGDFPLKKLGFKTQQRSMYFGITLNQCLAHAWKRGQPSKSSFTECNRNLDVIELLLRHGATNLKILKSNNVSTKQLFYRDVISLKQLFGRSHNQCSRHVSVVRQYVRVIIPVREVMSIVVNYCYLLQ
jgi:hypothetical protein